MATSSALPHSDGAAPSSFQVQRWVFAFGCGAFILASYVVLANWNLARFADGTPPIRLDIWLDHHVPFVPEAFWIYIGYYLIAISPAWLARRWSDFTPMVAAYGVATAIAWAAWIALPIRMIPPPLDCSGLTCGVLLRFIDADGGVNVFPSMHVAHSMLAALFHLRHRSAARWLVVAGALGVTASTVLIRQHYVVDIPAGVATAAIGWMAGLRVAGVRDARRALASGSRCAS